jgi:molybdopterin-containing oxidoreductase family membrane subunit
VRLNIVVPGLAVPELPGLEAAFTGPGLTTNYFPSLSEWLLFVWAVGLAGVIFLAGRRLLPIIHTER